MIETGSAYLRIVGPTYGFLGLGLALYFASQGAARLLWPLLSGFLRVIVAIGGGWLALRLTGSLNWLVRGARLGPDCLRRRAYGGDHIRRVVWSRANHKCARLATTTPMAGTI